MILSENNITKKVQNINYTKSVIAPASYVQIKKMTHTTK